MQGRSHILTKWPTRAYFLHLSYIFHLASGTSSHRFLNVLSKLILCFSWYIN
jgi:hypothetical protein